MKKLAVAMLLTLCACGSVAQPGSAGAQPSGSGSPPAPSPSSGPLSLPDLGYRLIDSLGPPFYCDPWIYPVARPEAPPDAGQEVEKLRAGNPAEFDAIVRHEHLNEASLSANDDEHILQQARELAALPLTPVGPRYRFRYQLAGPPQDEVAGTIDQRGAISVESRVPAPRHPCPICLAQRTRIATPSGEVPVSQVRRGMLVWTLNAAGGRVAAPVLAVAHTLAPPGHEVVHLTLTDGRSVDVSPGHPLMDGRWAGDLVPGDWLDGAVVASAVRRPYHDAATWDLLPSGTTHVYWAEGIPLGSTLAGPAQSGHVPPPASRGEAGAGGMPAPSPPTWR